MIIRVRLREQDERRLTEQGWDVKDKSYSKDDIPQLNQIRGSRLDRV